jgi:hypothetical protein
VNDDAGFCLWLSGQPASVVASIARAAALELGHHRPVEEVGLGLEWLAGAEPDLRWRVLAHLARTLVAHGVVVVLATDPPREGWRVEVRQVVPRLVEAHVGRTGGDGRGDSERAPEVLVDGDGARAGESARVVLRYLAAAGYSEPIDEYTDDDEAAVSGRLQAFGYL